VDLVKQGWKTFFRGLADDDAQGKAAAPVFETLNCKTLAVVNDKSAYGQGLAQVVAPTAKDAGVDVVLDEGIEPTADYTALVDSVLAKDPDALFYAGYASEFQLVVKQLREKGYEGLIASGDGSKTATLGSDIGEDAAEGVVLLCPCGDPNASSDPKDQAFAKDYKAAFDVQPEIYAAEGYDVANVTIEAIRSCGEGGASGITRQCVVDEVSKIDYEGLTKRFRFAENGQVTPGPIIVYVIKDGKITEIGPAADLEKS
jgi:branched-chain amino acid transport system substrate-binding protein